MTFDEYIKNPMGTKSSVMTNLQVYRQLYSDKWNKLMVRENGIVNYNLYIAGNDYYAHFKIPSEVVPKFYYDVIVRFYPPKGISKGVIRALSDCDVQFYSNDPNFVFTFAHAFKKKGMLIDDLESKMSKLAVKTKAAERNPRDELGYVKSLFFLYLAMKSLNLFSKSQWQGKSKPYSKKIWVNTVTHADDKIRDRQERGRAIEKKEKRLNATNKTTADDTHLTNGVPIKKFGSPNIKDFGHFKKTNFNTVGDLFKNGIKKNFSKIGKKSFK